MNKNKFYRVTSVRLCRYLYSLGFEKKSIYENNIENWLFKKSDALKEALDFYFYMRNKNRNNN